MKFYFDVFQAVRKGNLIALLRLMERKSYLASQVRWLAELEMTAQSSGMHYEPKTKTVTFTYTLEAK